MDQFREGITEYFISFILNKTPIDESITNEQRKLFAQKIIHQKEPQKIILEALLKLYPIVTDEVIKEKRKREKPKDGQMYAHNAIFVTKHYGQTNYEKFLNNYSLIQRQVKHLAEMIDKDAKNQPTITEKEIRDTIDHTATKKFQSEKLVGLLTEMGGYEPEFFLDIRDISHDT